MSVNRVILVGNLGADPESRVVGERTVCNLSVATSETFKDKSGVRQERTEWHRISVWGPLAETCAKYLTKGRSVYIEGKLQTRKYEKDGQTRYSTDIVADTVTFLNDGKGGGRSEAHNEAPNAGAPARGRIDGAVAGRWSPKQDAGSDDIPY